jgi:pimeloyl-ACP methyl ester carboxylesterase
MVLVGTAPRGAEDIMHLDKPRIATYTGDPQMAAFREWEKFTGERFADLRAIQQPSLVVNGIHDDMIPVSNSYWLSQHLPNAVLMTYPDSGHGSLFQFHESFTRQVTDFLASDSDFAPY